MVVYRNSAFFSPSKKTFSLITLNLKVFFYYLRFKLQMTNPKDSFIEKGMNSSYSNMAGSIIFYTFLENYFLYHWVYSFFFLYTFLKSFVSTFYIFLWKNWFYIIETVRRFLFFFSYSYSFYSYHLYISLKKIVSN